VNARLLSRGSSFEDSRGGRVSAEPLHHGEAVHTRHHEVLQDRRRRELLRDGERLLRVPAVVERDVLVLGEHPSNGLADDRLIIDE